MPKHILLADDSVTIQKVVELTFSEGDYQVTCVSNGKLALQAIQERRPDILLCDVIMPELNGYEVCSSVKHTPELAGIPVVLMTGTFEPFDEEKARNAGADTFITKPFESKLLVEKVEELLKRRMVLDATLPVESVQIFQSRQEFTLEAPVPSDEAFLEAHAPKQGGPAAAESPFLHDLPSAASAPTEPVAITSPPPPPEPPAPSLEEVFAPPPTMVSPFEGAGPAGAWDAVPPPPPPPTTAEALFDDALPPAPSAPPLEISGEEPPAFIAEEAPPLPPLRPGESDQPLEVVHDMMDQEQMVSDASAFVPQEMEVPAPEPSPFEEAFEAPPLEAPYESPGVASVPTPVSPEFESAPAPEQPLPAPEPAAFGEVPPAVPEFAPPAAPEFLATAPAMEESGAPGPFPFEEPARDIPVMPPPSQEAAAPEVAQEPEVPFAPEPESPFEEFPAPAAEVELAPEVAAEPEAPFVPAATAPEPESPFEEAPAAEAEASPTFEEAPPPSPNFVEAEIPPARPEPEEPPPPPPMETPPPMEWAPEVPAEVAPAFGEEAPRAGAAPPAEEEALPPEAAWMAGEASVGSPLAEEEDIPPPMPPHPVEDPGEEVSAFAEQPFPEVSLDEAPPPPVQDAWESSAPEAPAEPEPEIAAALGPPSPQDLAGEPSTPSVTRQEVEEAIRRAVAEMAPEIIRQVAWEVIPELAESIIKRRMKELESAEE